VGLAGPLGEVSDLLNQRARTEDLGLKRQLEGSLREKAVELGFDQTLANGDFNELTYELRKALTLAAQSQVEDGLWVFGEKLTAKTLIGLVRAVLRYEAGEGLSFRERLAQELGFNLTAVQNDPHWLDPKTLKGPETALARLDQVEESLLAKAINSPRDLKTALLAALSETLETAPSDPPYWERLADRLEDILTRAQNSAEMTGLINGLNGRFLTPGPSGSLGRGRAEIMPTGRNFYALDTRRLPTLAAVKTGQALAQDLLDKHKTEEGRYPQSVAFFWISSDLLQRDGEDLAQMLTLMGLKPQWSSSGLLTGVTVIPLMELKRPRIDLTIRISGIMRDSFSGTVELLDRAIQMVSGLDEPVEMNYVRAHTLENLKEQNLPSDSQEAKRKATLRIFSAAPGSCVSGVYLALMASAWRDEKDLADIYFQHGSYAFGEGVYGELAPQALKAALARVDVNYLKLSADAEDILGCGGYFGVQGGLSLVANRLQKRKIREYLGDSRDPKALKTRTLAEEINRAVSTRLLNPAWVAGQKRHGYAGAKEIAKMVGGAYGWRATTKAVDPAIFDGIVKTFFLDPSNREFFEQNNPYALEEMGRRLLEAASRNLWDPAPELLESLKAAYLSLEGVLEERTENFGGESQGGAVDILTFDDVASWRQKMDNWRAKAGDLGET
jgi:cobaltochelatase CobN